MNEKGIFHTFEALKPGEAFVLVNDHDPKPLCYQFKFERGRVHVGVPAGRIRGGKCVPGWGPDAPFGAIGSHSYGAFPHRARGTVTEPVEIAHEFVLSRPPFRSWHFLCIQAANQDSPADGAELEVGVMWGLTGLIIVGLALGTAVALTLVITLGRFRGIRRFVIRFLWCPFRERNVAVQFEEEAWDGRSVDVKQCTAFSPPTAVGCEKTCLHLKKLPPPKPRPKAA